MLEEQWLSSGQLMSTLKRRRSIGRINKDRLPPREVVEQLLEAAVWAPNHHMTEPWSFKVFTGQALEEMGNVFKEIVLANALDPEDHDIQIKAESAKKKPLRAPVVIMVICGGDGDKRQQKEDYASCAAGIQNMLLMAQEMGLAAIWRTGEIVDDSSLKGYYSIPERSEVVGMIYLGYPEGPVPERKPRTPVDEKTEWLGW